MKPLEIVILKQTHVDILLEFFEEINTPEYIDNFAPHPFSAEYAHRVCNYNGQDAYYAVLLGQIKVIGYCMFRGWDEGYEIPAIGLCVHKDFHGSGVGRLIMNFLETVARVNGCEKVMLKVKKDNLVASNLYNSMGYEFSDYNEYYNIGYKQLIKANKCV